ncbi:MAG TPA: glycosyltransferase family 2 protein [Sphingomonas sp.]
MNGDRAGDPLISVVMAAYRGAPWIAGTIASLGAQTMPDFEIVVVDDGSPDDTVAVLEAIREPRLRILRAPCNGGPAVARTIAMDHARGRFIAGLDQDDLCRPDRFARQLAYLDARPEVALVTSTIEMFGDGASRPDPFATLSAPDAIDWTMTMLNPLAWSTVLMRGEAARALVPFQRDERRFAEDFDLYQRIRAFGRIGRIVEPLVRYRVHPGGASQAFEDKMITAAARVLTDRYQGLFGDDARDMAAALLMSRHASAGYPPADAGTLRACGAVLGTLLAAYGGIAPDHAGPSAAATWWRIARAGLRAGRYGVHAMMRARPAFLGEGDPLDRFTARDAALGVARRIFRR